jgi:hypothetical protein
MFVTGTRRVAPEIIGSHGGKNVDCVLLGCDAV